MILWEENLGWVFSCGWFDVFKESIVEIVKNLIRFRNV